MRTKKEVIKFLESKLGTKVKCVGTPALDGQCVTLIKSLMEFLGVPDPYKKRGHAKTCISAYLNEEIADKGAGFISVFSNKNMGDGFGHVWCNAGDGKGTYYESNGQKALTVTKGKTYSYDAVCNFDKYIQEDTTMPTKDPLQECLTAHTKLVDEANKKDVTIKQLETNLSKKDTKIGELKISLEEKETENSTLKKQEAAQRGEVTKKENEIIDLKKQLEEAQKPQGVLVGKRKLLAGALAPLLGIIAKIIFHYTGIEITVVELLGLASLPLAYVGMEGTADIVKLIQGTQSKENTDSKGIN